MIRILLYVVAMLPAAASAQTPAADRMPDGSHDLYAGVGVQAGPRYEGADALRTRALPVVQFAWSNGLFVSGASLGWHLSSAPTVEFGPLLTLQPRRTAYGAVEVAGVVGAFSRIAVANTVARTPHRLEGVEPLPARLLGGGFFNYYLTPQWRWTNNVLAGGGRERNGVLWQVGVQRIGLAQGHHSISLGASLDIGNRAWNSAYSGVSDEEASSSGYAAYQAGAAVRAAHLTARWNWTLSPSWIFTSSIDASSLLDVARNSPLTVRSTGLTAATALAYRF
jgi:outer membrane protein